MSDLFDEDVEDGEEYEGEDVPYFDEDDDDESDWEYGDDE